MADDLLATLDAWRAAGADKHDPVRFRFIEALARRAASHDGEARRLLDVRLRSLVEAYGAALEDGAGPAPDLAGQPELSGARPSDNTRSPAASPRLATPVDNPAAADAVGAADVVGAVGAVGAADSVAALAALVERLASRQQESPSGLVAQAPAARGGSARHSGVRTEPDLIDFFRDTWTRVSVDRQLRESLERVPENAGPLHSDHLVHRSLNLMRDVSTGYLEHFMLYVDAMSWMEQLSGGAAAIEKEAVRSTPARKPTRARGKA